MYVLSIYDAFTQTKKSLNFRAHNLNPSRVSGFPTGMDHPVVVLFFSIIYIFYTFNFLIMLITHVVQYLLK